MKNRFEAFMAGQDKGRQGFILDPRNVPTDLLATYTIGWTVGWESVPPKMGRLVSKPAWMTNEQFGAIVGIFLRDTTVAKTFVEFFRKVEPYGDYCGMWWKGVFLGIEKDGYTHS